MSWAEWAEREEAAIRARGQWRQIRDLDGTGPRFRTASGDEVTSFASNDYLGLGSHPDVVAAACAAAERFGTSSGSARLIVGARPCHRDLEAELAEWKGCEASLLFPTGFAANLGVLTVVGGPGTTIVSDELNHASIIDGCRLARAHVQVYRHGDVDHAAKVLADAPGPAVVVTDTVFSMDGDVAPLEELVELCATSGALLVVDEAHAVMGPDPDLSLVTSLRVGTLSKTLGSLGGFVTGPRTLVDLIVNKARPFIFTTAPSPPDTAAAYAALGILRAPEGKALRAQLRRYVDRLRPMHPSPIIPVIIGDEDAAVAASDQLLAAGLLVPAIRPPTVAPGTSRLRVTVSAAHTDDDIDRLESVLAAISSA